jgi:F-type H+-transporting ATPase subunit b
VDISLIIPKLQELIPALVSFLVILFVASKFVWPPITNALDERATNIRESLERAEAARIEAERLLDEYKQTMADARKEAGAILQQAKQAAEATRAEGITKTQGEIDEMLVKARESIEGERRAAIASLQASVADLSVAVAGRLIGSELSPEAHRAVIEKYISEAGSLNAN